MLFDQYWGDVNYRGVVETQAGILRSSSMWMVGHLPPPHHHRQKILLLPPHVLSFLLLAFPEACVRYAISGAW